MNEQPLADPGDSNSARLNDYCLTLVERQKEGAKTI